MATRNPARACAGGGREALEGEVDVSPLRSLADGAAHHAPADGTPPGPLGASVAEEALDQLRRQWSAERASRRGHQHDAADPRPEVVWVLGGVRLDRHATHRVTDEDGVVGIDRVEHGPKVVAEVGDRRLGVAEGRLHRDRAGRRRPPGDRRRPDRPATAAQNVRRPVQQWASTTVGPSSGPATLTARSAPSGVRTTVDRPSGSAGQGVSGAVAERRRARTAAATPAATSAPPATASRRVRREGITPSNHLGR